MENSQQNVPEYRYFSNVAYTRVNAIATYVNTLWT